MGRAGSAPHKAWSLNRCGPKSLLDTLQAPLKRLKRHRAAVLAHVGDGAAPGRCLLEVAPVHHQLSAEPAHGGVLLGAVALGYDDHDPEPCPYAREGQRLAMVASRRRDDAAHLGTLTQRPVHVHEPAAHLERPRRGLVLVLQPHGRVELGAQQGSRVGRCRSERLPDDSGCAELVRGQSQRCGGATSLPWMHPAPPLGTAKVPGLLPRDLVGGGGGI